ILVAIEADTSYRPTSIEFAPIPLNPPAESEPPPPERGEIDGLRNDLTAQRRELYRRYQERRDRLAGLQQAVDTAARNLQARKRQVESERSAVTLLQRNLETQRQDLVQRESRVTEIGRASCREG